MTGTVIPFKRPNRNVAAQQLNGPAVCLACRHDWHAITPIGVTALECPNCRTMRGVWAWPIIFGNGFSVRECPRCQGTFVEIAQHESGGFLIGCLSCGSDFTIDEVFGAKGGA